MGDKVVLISCFNHYEIQIKQIIKFFKNVGFGIMYITTDFNHHSKKHQHVEYPDSKQIKVIGYNRNISFSRILSHYMFAKKTVIEITKIKPSLIFVEIPPNFLLREIIRYKKKSGCKVIVSVYDFWPESFPYTKSNIIIKFFFELWKRIRQKNISFADLIVCVSEAARQNVLKEASDKKTVVLRPFVNDVSGVTYVGDVSKQITFCYLGNVNHIMDIDVTIALLTEINKIRRTVLHIIGTGQHLDKLLLPLTNNNIEVVCHGVIFAPELKNKIFSGCTYGLNVAKSVVNVSLSIKSIEYLSVGLPIINTVSGDTNVFVNERNIGINLDINNISKTANEILSINELTLNSMRNNCLNLYKEKFLNQNLNILLDVFK